MADGAQAAISDAEITQFMRGITDSLKTCRISELKALVAPSASFTFVERSKPKREPVQQYLAGLDAICRAGGGDEPGFKITNSSYALEGDSSRVRLTASKSYTWGWVKARRVKAVLKQELLITRKNPAALWVTRVREEAEYRDLDDRQKPLSFEDAHPVGPIAHLGQIIKGWVRPAREPKGR